VLFTDRSLGGKAVPTALRADGHTVERHDDHFAPTTPDVDWLAEVGRRGWVVLSKDPAIRRRDDEREALLRGNVRAFFLARGNQSALQMIATFRAAMPEIQRLAAAHAGSALIVTILRDGTVRVDHP
jgi:hypothetical protein